MGQSSGSGYSDERREHILQLIFLINESAGNRVRSGVKLNLALILTLSLALPLFSMMSGGCSGGVVQRVDDPKRLPPPPPRQGFLRLPRGPDSTRIYIDERFMGRFVDYPRRALLLPVGDHRVQLRASGYATVYALITISSHQPIELDGSLLRLPPTYLRTLSPSRAP